MSRQRYCRLLASLALLALLLALVVAVGTAKAEEEEAVEAAHPDAVVAEQVEVPVQEASAPEVAEVVTEVEAVYEQPPPPQEAVQEAEPVQEHQHHHEDEHQQQYHEEPETRVEETVEEVVDVDLVTEEVPVVDAEQQQTEEQHVFEPEPQQEEPEQQQQQIPPVVEEPEYVPEPQQEESEQQQQQVPPVVEEPEYVPEPQQEVPEPQQEEPEQQVGEPVVEQEEVHTSEEPVTEKPKEEYQPEVIPKHGEAPEVQQGGSTVRWNARVMPEGCVKGVEKYLKHIHEGRRAAASEVTEARAQVNEARVHHPKQVAKAEEALEVAEAKLAAYDAETIATFGGDLPKTCLKEVEEYLESLPAPTTQSNFLLYYTHFFRVISAHTRVFAMLCRGEFAYVKSSYDPMLTHFNKFADTYYSKAKAHFKAAHPKPGLLDKITGKQKQVPTGEFVKSIAQGAAYACVPLVVTATIAIVALAFAPVLIAAFVVPDIMYAMYMKLFLFFYTYGMVFPRDAIVVVKDTIAAAQDKKWATIGNSVADAFFDLAGDNYGFYNGVLMMATVFTVAIVLFFIVWLWLSCCCFRGGRKPESELKKQTKAAAPSKASVAKKKN